MVRLLFVLPTVSRCLSARAKVRRDKQLQCFNEHKAAQFADRRVYWQVRSEAQLLPTIVCIIIDGMGQGKFAYPRSPCMKAKDLESLQRPRLHVNAAIAHGRQLLVTVAHADTLKDTNYNITMISNVLTKLKQQGVLTV